jgi:hypothetical protein
LSRRCGREERHTAIDGCQGQVLGELCEHGKDVFGYALGAAEYDVVGVVFGRDALEKEEDDAGHEVLGIGDEGDKAGRVGVESVF